MDLKTITPDNVEQSVDGSLLWLANQCNGHWLLFFDNADDVQLKLKKFFPPCTSGNILVTTRNRELRHYTTKGSEQNVTGMDHKDATNLLLQLSQAEKTDENKALAAEVVQVISVISCLGKSVKPEHDTGTPPLRFGSLSSWRLHSLPFIIKQLSRILPTRTRQSVTESRDSRLGPIRISSICDMESELRQT